MVFAEKQNWEKVASRETLRHTSTCKRPGLADAGAQRGRAESRCARNPTSTYLESALGGAARFCYSRRTNGDQQQGGGPRVGTRLGAERSRRAEHDRNRGDWTIRGQFAGDSGNGRPAGADRVAGRGTACNAGWICVVRARRGDAESRGHLCFSARGLWPGEVGPTYVVSVRVAISGASAAFDRLRFHRLRQVCGVSASPQSAAGQGHFRKLGGFYRLSAVPPDHDHRKNLRFAVDRSRWDHGLADLGRDAALRRENRV